MQATYYIKLPQGIQALVNGNNQNYNLVTFLGAANLRALTSLQVRTNILNPVQQNAPVLLSASVFNLQSSNTNSNNIDIEVNHKILKLAWHQICTSVFVEICNGYMNQPQAALDHIKQCYIDSDENQVCIPVFAYYQHMMNAMRPFAGNKPFPKSVCNVLIGGMSTHLQRIFCKYYPNHSMLHNLFTTFQCSCFHQILTPMQTTEDEVASISAIARDSIGSQAFATNTSAFPSQAKCTLDCYANGGYAADRSKEGCSDSSRASRNELGCGDKCFVIKVRTPK
jgi:hypothetical protein